MYQGNVLQRELTVTPTGTQEPFRFVTDRLTTTVQPPHQIISYYRQTESGIRDYTYIPYTQPQ